MADWRGVQQGLESGYVMGRQTGGSLSGIGQAIAKVADRLKQTRETGEAMNQTKEILGFKGLLEGTVEPTKEGGVEVPGIGRVKRKAGLLDNITVSPDGELAYKVGDAYIPLRSISKTGLTAEKGQGVLNEGELQKLYADYINKSIGKESSPLNYQEFKDAVTGKTTTSTEPTTQGWENVGMIDRLKSAFTPTATADEKKYGALRIGGVFNPPKRATPKGLPQGIQQSLPEGITEEDIQHTMKLHGLTREEVLTQLNAR